MITAKRVIIILYLLPLCVFLGTTIFATVADFTGDCVYTDGVIERCIAFGVDFTALYDRSHMIGFVSDWSFLVVWIMLGGGVMYGLDWWSKKHA